MGEFGVINYQKLSANRPILEVLSLLIDYPTADTFTEANRTLIEQDKALSKDERRSLLEIFDQLAKPVLLKQQTN